MTDRHRKGYYAEYNKKRKAKGLSTDRHRKGYYAEYNRKHPERLARIGIYLDDEEDEFNYHYEIRGDNFDSDSYDDCNNGIRI